MMLAFIDKWCQQSGMRIW